MKSDVSSQYYTYSSYIKNFYDDNSRKWALKAEDVSAYELWKNHLRETLKDLTGMSLMKSCELAPKLIESRQFNGYRRDKVVIQTEPEVYMPMYILIPDGLKEKEKRPGIIAAHGHGSGGKYAVAGNTDIPGIKEQIEKYNYDYGLKYVKEGYIVFCSDARAAGERRELLQQGDSTEAILSSSCNSVNFAAISMGQSLIGMMTWDLMRLIDYIETFDFCDNKSIACVGFSGGGLQSLWLAALDDRIKCVIVSGYFHGFRDTILKTNQCGCNFVPNLWRYIDIGDLGALIAPRPLLIESGSKDGLNGERGLTDVYEQIEITKKAYELNNCENQLYHHVFDGGHIWNGEKSYEFINEFLGGF
jgi:cephalosporin-C deacetylase-like acetyl esterase